MNAEPSSRSPSNSGSPCYPDGQMGESVVVRCPWCGESLELWVEPDTRGMMVQDCDVCCRPWQVHVAWDDERGACQVMVTRA